MDTSNPTGGSPSLTETSLNDMGTNTSATQLQWQAARWQTAQLQAARQQASQPQTAQQQAALQQAAQHVAQPAAQQAAQQQSAQQAGQHQNVQQQAAVADFFRRFQAEAQTLGVHLPFTQQNIPQALTGAAGGVGGAGGVSGTSGVGGPPPYNFHACNPFQGNFGALNGTSGTHNSVSAGPRAHFERVTGELPIDKFPYGTPDADWTQWCERFEKAVQVATNAFGQARLHELCLIWIPLKLSKEAQPIYDKCEYKNRDWPLLKAELTEALEDPMIRRKWARHMDAYKKPASMSLQVYRAKIVGFVNKYSSALARDPTAYNMELYNRFVIGLEADWREYIEESIPYKKESLDNAYSQALKYEAKLAKKGVCFGAAAMTDKEKDKFGRLRRDVEKLKTQLAAERALEESDGSTSSGKGSVSNSDSSNDDSDAEHKEHLVEIAVAALSTSMKGLSVRPKDSKKYHSRKH